MNDGKKYELVAEDTIDVFGIKLFRIRSTRTFGEVGKGDLGGYVESEESLSHVGEAWVSGEAQVSGEARVFGKAQVFGEAWVSGEAQVSGEARVFGKAQVFGKARVFGKAQVFGKARVFGKAQVSGEARVFGEAQVDDWKWLVFAEGVEVPVPAPVKVETESISTTDEAQSGQPDSNAEIDSAIEWSRSPFNGTQGWKATRGSCQAVSLTKERAFQLLVSIEAHKAQSNGVSVDNEGLSPVCDEDSDWPLWKVELDRGLTHLQHALAGLPV